MIDISDTIKAKSDQLNADDLISGPITITITKVSKQDGDQPVSINYIGDNKKPYLPCKQMRRVLCQLWGIDASKYIGRSLTLFRDASVTWGGAEVGGIRISNMSDIEKKQILSLTMTQRSKKPVVILPLGEIKQEKREGVDIERLKSEADNLSGLGSDELKKWFTALSNNEKVAFKPLLDEYKVKARQNDDGVIDE